MADLSFSFDPSDMTSKIAANSNAASDALSKIAVVSDAASSALASASDATSKVSNALSKASDASSKIQDKSATWDKGSSASSNVAVLSAKVIHSEPGSGSRAVHEIIIDSASNIKYVYSSNAEA